MCGLIRESFATNVKDALLSNQKIGQNKILTGIAKFAGRLRVSNIGKIPRSLERIMRPAGPKIQKNIAPQSVDIVRLIQRSFNKRSTTDIGQILKRRTLDESLTPKNNIVQTLIIVSVKTYELVCASH